MNSKSVQNKSIQNYFANISVIPEDVRKSYLKKILKRKDASRQKNVKLIKILYAFVEAERINDWDEAKICARLDISKNMLYWHKSSLLKELRKHYFGWKEIEKKEFSVKPAALQNKEGYDKTKFSYEKAKKMFEIGMRQEAKSTLLILAKNIEGDLALLKVNFNQEKILLLSNIYGYLIRYYYGCRNWLKFNLYFTKLEEIKTQATSKLADKDIVLIEMIYLIAKSLRSTFKAFDVSDYTKGLEHLFTAHKKAKNLREDEYLFYITILIDDISIRLKHKSSDKVEKCIKEAGKAAVRNNNEYQILTYKALKVCFELETTKLKSNEYYLNTVRESYEKVKLLPRNSYFTIIQGILIRVLGMLGLEEEFIRLTKDLYYSYTLESSKFSAWWKLYIYENMKIDENRYTWKLYKNPACRIPIPVINEINSEGLSNLNAIVTHALTNYKKIFSFFVYYAIYQGIILAEFFTDQKGDYKRTLLFIKKLVSIQKDASVKTENYVELIRSGITIIEEKNFHTEEFIASKHKGVINASINNFIANENGTNLIDRYAILVRIAQLTDLKFIWRLTEDFYRKLQKKIPEDVKVLLYEIKNKNYSKAS